MFFSITSVTTDAILAAARNHPEKIGCTVNRVEKITGSAEKNRVRRDTTTGIFFYALPGKLPFSG
jgi:hypothetical protein